MRRPHLGLVLAIGVYLALRWLLLYTAFDDVALPAYELHPMGTLARNVVGPPSIVPVHFYYDNAAGAQLVSFAAGCLMRVFGTNYLALKAISFFEMIPALIFLWLLLRRHFGLAAAVLGSLLFALPPTTLAKYQLIVVGNHSENIPFMLLAMVVFFRAHVAALQAESGGRPSGSVKRWWFAAGLCAGFALVIFLGVLIPLGLLFLTHVGLRGWRRTLGDLVPALAGFAIGLGPLIWFTLTAGARGASFLGAKFEDSAGGFDFGLFASRVADFYTVYLPDAATHPDLFGIPGAAAGVVFLVCTIAAYGWCVVAAWPEALRLVRGAFGRGVERPDLGRVMLVPFVLYLPLTSIAFGLSDLRMGEHQPPLEAAGYRYFLPHLVMTIVMIAVVATRLWEAGAWRRVAGGALATGAVATGLFTFGIVDASFATPNLGVHYEGFNAKQHARPLVHVKNSLTHAEVRTYAEQFTPTLRARVYEGLGYYSVLRPHLKGLPPDLERVFRPFPEQRWPDLARGAGVELRQPLASSPRYSPAAVATLAGWLERGRTHAEQVVEGYAFQWNSMPVHELERHLERNADVLARLPAALRPHFARGIGIDCGRYLRREIPAERPWLAAAIAGVDADLRGELLRGLGMGLADGREQPGFGIAIEELVPVADAEPVLRGFHQRLVEIWGPRASAPHWRSGVEQAPSEWGALVPLIPRARGAAGAGAADQ